MTRYKNLEFYFYVFVFFFAFLIYKPMPVYATGNDVRVHITNASDVYTYNNFYVSNFSRVENGSVNSAIPYFDNRQVLVGRNCGINGRNPCGVYYTEDADISSSGNIQRNMLIDIASPRFANVNPLYGGGSDSSNYKNVVQFRFWTNKDYSHLEFNKEYQIALKIQKDSNLTFGGVNASLLHIYITDNDNPTGAIDITGSVDKTARMMIIDNNHAFLVINFKFDTNNHVYNFQNFSLNNINISWIDSESAYNGDREDVSKLITYHIRNNGAGFILQNTSEEHPYYYKITNFYFLKTGFVSVGGDYITLDGTLSDDIGDEYTTLDEDDLNIYDADYYCNPTDLMCHINNIIRNIKNVFEKIGRAISSVIQKIVEFMNSIFTAIINALQNLFIPSDDFIEDFFGDQYDLLQEKLGILLTPFTIIGNILNRFINLQANHVISFNGYTLPIFNKALLPSFTFDFVSFFNEKQEIASLYNYYKIGVVAIIYILFLNLCLKKFKALIGGDNS